MKISPENSNPADQLHQFYYSMRVAGHSSVIDFGKETLRTTALISGGAAVALLAFVAQIATNEKFNTLAPAITSAIWMFGLSVLTAGLATASAYISQLLYQASLEQISVAPDPPFLVRNPGYTTLRILGVAFHILSAVWVLSCYGLMLVAFLRISSAFLKAFS